MLTESEREWLEDSEKWNSKLDIYDNSCFCPPCKYCEYFTETANGVFCQDAEDMWLYNKPSKCPLVPSKELLLEAADFEQRVAAKLAKVISNLVKEAPWPDIEAQATTPDLVLKWARLAVEEEMDGETSI